MTNNFGQGSSLPRDIGTVVVGGGIVGMCIAGFLADEGRDVAIIDNWAFGGTTANAGSLHVQMQSRFMRMYPDLVDRLERALPLYPRAVSAWQALEAHLHADFQLRISGGLMIAEDHMQYDFLARKCRRERALGLDVHMIDRAELLTLAPYLNSDVFGAEFCGNEGKLNPLLCNAAVRDWLVSHGVIMIERQQVKRIRPFGSQFMLEMPLGEMKAGVVILAAASGVRPLAAELGINVPAIAEPLHMNITEPAEALIKHLVQHADRQITLKQLDSGHIVIGGGWPAEIGGRRAAPTVELASLVANASLALHLAPQIGSLRLIRTWAGYNTTTDGGSVLGEIAAGLFVAVPGDAGYTLAPLIARAVADAVLGRMPEIDITPYAASRFGPLSADGRR